jgi:hypothetical protein
VAKTLQKQKGEAMVDKGHTPGAHKIVPLPFSASSLQGRADRMVTSHHANNYGDAVNNLNKVELALAEITGEAPVLTLYRWPTQGGTRVFYSFLAVPELGRHLLHETWPCFPRWQLSWHRSRLGCGPAAIRPGTFDISWRRHCVRRHYGIGVPKPRVAVFVVHLFGCGSAKARA